MRPRICLEVWGPDPRRLIAVARHVEEVGLDGVYLGESPTALNTETWTTLGSIAAVTSHIRLGPVIANLLPDYRSPVLLARQAASLAVLSDGRFDFRTGVGADASAARPWWEPAGVAYPPYDQRAVEVDHQLGILRTLWRGQSVRLGDRPYALELDHPPIEVTVAATSDRALGLAARRADRWETSHATPDEWVARAASAPPGLATSLEIDGFVGTADDPERVWRRVETDRAGEDLVALRTRSLVGSPETVADRLAGLAAASVDQVVVAPHDPNDLDAISALAKAAMIAGDRRR